jgi:hypothetical protein
VVNVVLQFGATHLEFFDFLVGGEIDLFFDAIDFVVEPVVLREDVPKVIVAALQAANGFTMFRKLSQDGMMKVHGDNLLF